VGRPRQVPLLLLLALCACGDNAASWGPLLLGHSSISTGQASFALYGVHFTPGLVPYWEGRPQVTQGVSDGELIVQLDEDATKIRGQAMVFVQGPGRPPSNRLIVEVRDSDLVLSSVSPCFAEASAEDLTLTLTGTGFAPDSQASWNHIPLQTLFVSSTLLHALLPASLRQHVGSGVISVSQGSCRTPPCSTAALVCMLGVFPSSDLRIVRQQFVDAAWDLLGQRILVAASVGSAANSILTVDPMTGSVSAGVLLDVPTRLSVSDDHQFLFAGSAHVGVTRYELPGLTAAQSWVLSSEGAQDVQPAPGDPDTAAVIAFSTLGIFHRDRELPDIIGSSSHWLQWASPTRLFASGSGQLLVLDVGAQGVSLFAEIQGTFGAISYAPNARLLYSASGRITDLDGRTVGSISTGLGNCTPVLVDEARHKVFLGCFDGAVVVRSFDLTTGTALGTLFLDWIDTYDFPLLRLLTWGSDGLALLTSTRIFMYHGAFAQ
jgi:hypothetical protein